VLRNYPAYRIEDFYVKSYREGGLTYQQFLFLHKSADDHLYNQNRFMAGIHGIDLEGTVSEVKTSAAGPKSSRKDPVLFGDPADYAHLSEQERKDLTQKMLNHWKPLGSKMLESKRPEYHS